jgi:site-specific DNA recombinase
MRQNRNISRILKNIVYAGKIKVPMLDNEPEEIVEGLHKPIINIDIFNKVQRHLDSKSRYKYKPKKVNETLYLRGFLKCQKCGGNLTGSASRSKTGDKHYYYHCNPRKGCNVRYKIKEAHVEFDKLISDLKPSEEVCELFELVMSDYYLTSKNTKFAQMEGYKKSKLELELKKDKLLDKLLSDVINDDAFKGYISKIDLEISELNISINNLSDYEKDLSEYIKFSMKLFKNIQILFKEGTVEIKQKMMSSIFDENLEFNGLSYRTPKYKAGVAFIYSKIKEFGKFANKKGDTLSNISHVVLGTGLEPVRP